MERNGVEPMATFTVSVTRGGGVNTPDQIAILMPQILTQIQPQIVKCPVPVPQGDGAGGSARGGVEPSCHE